jgi:uncharacterized protein
MSVGDPAGRSPLRFFLLVFLLTVPFLVLAALNDGQIVPGVPLAGLAVVCPVLAALILEYRRARGVGVRALLRRSFDARRITRKAWYLPTLLLYPAVLVLSFVILRLRGVAVPDPSISVTSTVLLAVGFFVGALGEELGWSGYALEPLRHRWGVLTSGLLLGSVWAVWHWVPLLEVGRPPAWIAWWSLYTVAARVIMVWLFANGGGSVFAMVLFHMVLNLGWQLFPVDGSYFDQPLVAVIMAGVAVVVTIVWWPGTSNRSGHGADRVPPGGPSGPAAASSAPTGRRSRSSTAWPCTADGPGCAGPSAAAARMRRT